MEAPLDTTLRHKPLEELYLNTYSMDPNTMIQHKIQCTDTTQDTMHWIALRVQ